jgi:FtsH-binding integral membrane protein
VCWPFLEAKDRPGVELLVSWLVTFWLIWRVWRGGRISHWILIILGSGLGCVNAAFHIAKHPAALILLIVYVGQLALLLSPALDRHTNPRPAADIYDA